MTLEKTKLFYEQLKHMNFWKRVFSWSSITSSLMESYAEIEGLTTGSDDVGKLKTEIAVHLKDLEEQKNKVSELKETLASEKTRIESVQADLTKKEKELSKLEETKEKNAESISSLKSEISSLKTERDLINTKNTTLEKNISKFEKTKEEQQQKYDEMIVKLTTREETLETRRQELEDYEVKKETERFEEMKKTWRLHEDLVEQRIKQICNKYTISYFSQEQVPFKGKPDNTIQIAGEYIIFDAKSPASDNLDNFPTYIKTQSESLKKYAKQQDVKKDIFLVVPTNTIDIVSQTYFNLGAYNVYVVTLDSLEPIILSLQKIEAYEFAEELSPEDRENICRTIGRFAHTTKRRIQIDQFFSEEFIDILSKTHSLPEAILENAVKYEKTGKLNPPMEKRTKEIDLKTVSKDVKRMKREAEAKNILIEKDGMKKIEEIPLEKED